MSLDGKPSDLHFHEEFPHTAGPWVYDHAYLDESFDYQGEEGKHMKKQASESLETLKEQLDKRHQ